MHDHIAVLGRQPQLGLAELESIYGSANIRPLGKNNEAALVSIPSGTLDFDRLGGCIKACTMLSILDTIQTNRIERYLTSEISHLVTQMPDGKVHLGISAYGLQLTPQQLMAVGLRIKKVVHGSSGRTVRLVPNNSTDLNSAQVQHNKLVSTNGIEIVLVQTNNQTYVGRTTNIQDIEAYGKRDFGRPKRDARVGMLPPKLAQIIINLATGPTEQSTTHSPGLDRAQITITDPFCGTGVILQEALLMGYQAYGTDVEPRMIAYSQANLDWLVHETSRTFPPHRLNTGDATSMVWEPPVDVIASEIYLGKPFTEMPASEVLAQTVSDCNLILKKFLQNVHDQLRSGTRLCLAIPAWSTGADKFRFLPLIDHLHELGYNLVSLQHVRNEDLLYHRAEQIVARQLLLITRN